MRPLLFLFSSVSLVACATGGSNETEARRPEATTTTAAKAVETPADPYGLRWADVTRSPWSVDDRHDVREELLGATCGEPDGAIARVARYVADERARGMGAPDPDAVSGLLRAAGEPHLRPRVLGALGRGVDDDRLKEKIASLKKGPLTRCAVAIARTPHGGEVLVAIAVEALADLAPLPLRARTGEWLTFEAALAVGARSASLVILGPRGLPRTVPTAFDPKTGHARARFALDRPGAFRVQLVADLESGPRPLLEARVFADAPLPTTLDVEPAPGEEAANGKTGADALEKMIAAARAAESLAPLTRDPHLDDLARAHAEKMRDAGSVAHDLGEGDLQTRYEAEGLPGTRIGENVARAGSEVLVHRALWASPSHRMNLLRAEYTHVGLATAEAPDGTVYACEVFAARPRR